MQNLATFATLCSKVASDKKLYTQLDCFRHETTQFENRGCSTTAYKTRDGSSVLWVCLQLSVDAYMQATRRILTLGLRLTLVAKGA